MPNPLKCCNCGKKIAEEIAIQAGVVKITCKCGTVNEVRAAMKEREQYQTKDEPYEYPYIETTTRRPAY